MIPIPKSVFTGLAIIAAMIAGVGAGEPIRLHPDNPHYFLWQGKPAVLVTATEHYGAVMNLDFDYKRYLNELKSNGFNLTRVFSGTYREVRESFNLTGNTLAPAKGRYVCPWARSEIAGAADGGNKFDLAKWDPVYLDRLKDFITVAGRQGVVVELVLFCTMYDEAIWGASPMNGRNNINGIGNVGRTEMYDGKDQRLLEVQKAVVTKLVTELNEFDNLYFELCNEPYERGGLTKAWNNQITTAIADTEARLPKKHLIAQNFPPTSDAVSDLDSRVSILNFHAAKPDSVRLNYATNRAVAFDETGGSDQSDRKYRTEGWDWMMSGGGVYDHLDFSFTFDHPDGSAIPLPAGTPGGGGPQLRRQLRVLKEFIESFPLVQMRPDHTTITSVRYVNLTNRGGRPGQTPTKPIGRALSKPGEVYAIYVNGGEHTVLDLQMPAGRYKAEWIYTTTGPSEATEIFDHAGGIKTVVAPVYREDIALRVTRQPSKRATAGMPPAEIAGFFTPPEQFRADLGKFRSPLLFADGTRVRSSADWQGRRSEILSTWHKIMGPWPALIERPRVEVVNTSRRGNITQQQLRLEIALGGEMVEALLLVPDGDSARKRPAVLAVYYDAETGAGLGAPWRDYGWQLARRGFVTLSVGKPNAHIDLTTTNRPSTEPYLGPVSKPVQVQPLSALAYAAANAHTVLAQRPEVDPNRIGIVGHSFGGKWAMFASCLYEKFACAVWSDPGIVFDERDRRKQNPSGSVNYWDVGTLGPNQAARQIQRRPVLFANCQRKGSRGRELIRLLLKTGMIWWNCTR